MAETLATGLVVPESLPTEMSNKKVFEFVRNLFIANGCLGDLEDKIVSGTYFKYSRHDYGERSSSVVRYASQSDNLLIFETKVDRRSQQIVNDELERSRYLSDSQEFITPYGVEAYHVLQVPLSGKIEEADFVFGASEKHLTGSTNRSWPERIDVYGRFRHEAPDPGRTFGFSREYDEHFNTYAFYQLMGLILPQPE